MKKKRQLIRLSVLLLLGPVLHEPEPAQAQTPVGTAFTYQGRLIDGGSPANGVYDLQFALFDAPSGGSQVGPTLVKEDMTVTDGLYSVTLDFGGGVFAGEARWLEMGVRPGASTDPFTVLSPREEMTPTPNAIFSHTVPWVGLSGKPAGFADDTDNDALGELSCAPGQVAAWTGARWRCATNGDITGVAAGTGLTGGATSGEATLSVNFAGRGSAGAVARSDHDHLGQFWRGSADSIGVYGLHVTNVSGTGIGAAGDIGVGAFGRIGVYGETDVPPGIGVFGDANFLTSGVTVGVQGRSLAIEGIGVKGEGKTGVKGEGQTGVLGLGTKGVEGRSFLEGIPGVFLNTDPSGQILSGRVGGSSSTPEREVFSVAGDGTVRATGLVTQANATSPNLIGGFSGNSVTPGVVGATIGGGGESIRPNVVFDNMGTVGGGSRNEVGTPGDPVGNSSWATVGGGLGNRASAHTATVGGGSDNTASELGATVPGGRNNIAAGIFSFAAGQNAEALHDNAFVWSDGRSIVRSTVEQQFTVQASGGVRFFSNSDQTAGVRLEPGAPSWSNGSDRASKEDLAPVDGRDLLARLNSLPVLTWSYRSQDPSIRHMGPTAQDFRAAFGLGEDETHISTVDADGVALAAIQALYRMALQKDEELRQLRQEVAELRALLARPATDVQASR